MNIKEKIIKATSVRQMNAIRKEVVEEMHKDKTVLTLWQSKYWKLKRRNGQT